MVLSDVDKEWHMLTQGYVAVTNQYPLLAGASGIKTPQYGQLDVTKAITGVTPIANGGTGSATQNFVDLTTDQTIKGLKTFQDEDGIIVKGKNTKVLRSVDSSDVEEFSIEQQVGHVYIRNKLVDKSVCLAGTFGGGERTLLIANVDKTISVYGTVTGVTPTADGHLATKKYVDDKSGGSGIPSGVIVMWSGTIATIPSGWYLCDGTNGTPDLRDRFIVGAKQDDSGVAKTNVSGSLTQTGGSKDHTHSAHGVTISPTIDAHSVTQPVIRDHAVTQPNAHTAHSTVSAKQGTGTTVTVVTSGSHNNNHSGTAVDAHTLITNVSVGNHTISATGSLTNNHSTDSNLVPYYALAFIMKA